MTATTLDFSKLGLQDALDLAVLVEEEAHERYLELTDQMQQHHTPEAAQFFTTMAGNEKKHGEELRAQAGEDGLGGVQAPAGTSDLQAVLDQVPAGALDHLGAAVDLPAEGGDNQRLILDLDVHHRGGIDRLRARQQKPVTVIEFHGESFRL